MAVSEKSALVLHGSFPKGENVLGRDWGNFSSESGEIQEVFIFEKYQEEGCLI
ncbi:hypothetical protein [Sulfuricurvum sp.]|uniref:hypothetical protein n=1 Tax=Sulfuricurvum sp. TaxID=2025608 RepID=UPI002639E8BB|nr:hypothetical protein [Sulfuricurvum sp.]MDD2781452.1 hypothetical protein [Sulfuricurvum sp.]